jgi:hypothetical protein
LPVEQSYTPTSQAFVGVHAPPATQLQWPAPSQKLLPPQAVPGLAGWPVSVQVTVLPHASVPLSQTLAEGAQAAPAWQATQLATPASEASQTPPASAAVVHFVPLGEGAPVDWHVAVAKGVAQ